MGFRVVQYQVLAEPPAIVGGETITEDKWHQPWSLPVRIKPPLPIGAYQFLAYSESAQFPETVTEDRWHQPWSVPSVLAKAGLRTGDQAFLAFQPMPSPFVASGWFAWLAEPVRLRPRLPEGEQQFLAFHPAPSPFVATGWFDWLSEPVRFKPGLLPALQQFFATDLSVIPLQELIEWFAPYSEPVRFKPGLLAALQQFLAAPPRLLPTPSVTGSLLATETKDIFFAGGARFNAPTSADVGITELLVKMLAGIAEKGTAAPLAGIVEQGASPASGAVVPIITSAAVAIRAI